MDINRIRYFLAVVETKSLRRAAELLMISPAALSKALKILESELGFTLLLAAGRGIDISYEGLQFAKKVAPLLNELEVLPRAIRESGFESKRNKALRIGSFEVFTTYFLRALMKSLDEDVDLELRELIPGEMERALVNNEIDYAINYLPIPTQGIDFIQAGSIEMGIFGRSDFIKAKDALDLPFAIPIAPVSGTPNKVQGLDGWPEHKIARKAPYKVSMLESALELCRQGKAVIYAPTFLIEEHNAYVSEKYQLKKVPAPRGLGNQKFPVYLMKRKQDPESPVFNQIARAIRLSKV
jgi:DNA-binding transcriptional LysR family regulator